MKRRRAFTLIEAAISVAIVGVLMTASAGTFSAIARSQRVTLERREAYMIAGQLLAEVMQQPFTDGTAFGPKPGQYRNTFDDVDNYNGYTSSPPQNQGGTVLTDYPNWTESVAVTYVDPNNPANVAVSSTLKQITVTITAASGKQYSLVGLRSKYGAYEAVPQQQINYVTGVAIILQESTSGKKVFANAHPFNISTSQ